MRNPIRYGALALLVLVALSGCQTRAGKLLGFPPRVELESLRLVEAADPARLELSVLVFNPNDVAVEIETLQVEFRLDDQATIQFQRAFQLDIGARNRERIRMSASASREMTEQLKALRDSSDTSTPYALEGELGVVGSRGAPVRLGDFLHPVPGQPNRFR